MTEFFLIRHGATKLNNNTNESVDKIRGWSDVPLSDEGRKEAQRTAIQLKGKGIDVLVHSDLGRSRETAEIIAKALGIKNIASKELRPWNLGEFTGKSTKEAIPQIAEYVKNKPDKPVPKGESFDKFKARAFKGVGNALRKHPGKLVGIVTHHRVERLVKGWIDAGQPSNHNIKLSTFLEKGEPTGKAEKLKINPLGYASGGTIRKRPTGGELQEPGLPVEDVGDVIPFKQIPTTPSPTFEDWATGIGLSPAAAAQIRATHGDVSDDQLKYMLTMMKQNGEFASGGNVTTVSKNIKPDWRNVEAESNYAAIHPEDTITEGVTEGLSYSEPGMALKGLGELTRDLGAHMASGGVPEGGQYKIQHGDTLGALSKRLGVPIPELMKLNPNLKNPDVIRAGDILSWQKPVPPTPPISGPKTGPTSQRGQEPLPTVPGPDVQLPATQAPPVETGVSGVPGGVGVGTALSKAPDPSDQFNPMSQNPGGSAAALKSAKDWTAGTEVNPPPNIPIEVVAPQEPPPPAPPPQKAGPSLWESIHSYIDPVRVLAGHSGDPDFKASPTDYAKTALMGIPSGTRLPEELPGDMPQPFRSTPGQAVQRALNTTSPSPKAPGWYKPRPWDNPVGPERDAGSIVSGSRPVFRGPDGNLRADPYAEGITPMSISPYARNDGGQTSFPPLTQAEIDQMRQQLGNPPPVPPGTTKHAIGGAPKPPKAPPTFPVTPTPTKIGSGPTGSELGLGIRTGRMASGFLHSTVPGRTDKLNLNVKNGSYVIPADVVAGHGQGNSLAGGALLGKLFGAGPYGATSSPARVGQVRISQMGRNNPASFPPPFRAEGGMTPGGKTHVPVMAAGGEFIVPPEAVLKIGGGNAERGFRILDKFVLDSRKKHVKQIKNLKPPRKD